MINFTDWGISSYRATHPDGDIKLWLPSGFLNFRDDSDSMVPFLSSLGIWERWKVWRCLKAEMRKRTLRVCERSWGTDADK